MIEIVNVDTPQLVPMPFTDRYMLTNDLELKYKVDGVSHSVIVPSGYITDGASIPKVSWLLVGTPYSPRFITAAIVHDYMCDNSWEVGLMSEIFKQLLVLSNVPSTTANLMYRAVYAYKTIKKNP